MMTSHMLARSIHLIRWMVIVVACTSPLLASAMVPSYSWDCFVL